MYDTNMISVMCSRVPGSHGSWSDRLLIMLLWLVLLFNLIFMAQLSTRVITNTIFHVRVELKQFCSEEKKNPHHAAFVLLLRSEGLLMRQCATANAFIRFTMGPWWKFRGVFLHYILQTQESRPDSGQWTNRGFDCTKENSVLCRCDKRMHAGAATHPHILVSNFPTFYKAEWDIQKYKKDTSWLHISCPPFPPRGHFLLVVVLCYLNRTSTSQSLQF